MPENFYSQEEVDKMIAEATASSKQQADEATQQLAQAQYGSPAGGGGGSMARPANRNLDAKQEAIERVHEWQRRGEGGQTATRRMDIQVMGTERLREAIDFQREAHPELGLGVGGSYRGEGSGADRTRVDARLDARKRSR